MDYTTEDIYYTLLGELEDKAAVPGVENAFEPGSLCDWEYQRLRQAYDRLLLRLKKTDEDADVEEILACMLSIQRELCVRMFQLGSKRCAD